MGIGTRAIVAIAGTIGVLGVAWHYGLLSKLTDYIRKQPTGTSENPPSINLQNPGNMEMITNSRVVFGGTLMRNSVTNAAITKVRIEVYKDTAQNREIDAIDPKQYENDIDISNDSQGFIWTGPVMSNGHYLVRATAYDAAGGYKGLVRPFIVQVASAPAPSPSPSPSPSPAPAPSTRLTDSQIQSLMSQDARLRDLITTTIPNTTDRCILAYFAVEYPTEGAVTGFSAIELKAIGQVAGDRYALLYPGTTPRWPCP